MKTKAYSVRLDSLVSISDKAYKATAFDGSVDIIPKSQVFGKDLEVIKSQAFWISAWIMDKKTIQYSRKKIAYFNENGKMIPAITIEKHIPKIIEQTNVKPIKNLQR